MHLTYLLEASATAVSMRQRKETSKLTCSSFAVSTLEVFIKQGSMDSENGFLYAFGLCRTYLMLIGLWPSSKNSKFREIMSRIRFTTITIIIVTFINTAQTIKLISIWGDLDVMTDNISTANLPIGVAVFKMFVFFNHKKDLEPLILSAMRDWCEVVSSKEVENMWKNARIARKMSLICTVLGVSAVNGHLSIRLCQEIGIIPSNGGIRQSFVNSYFPYDYQISPVYEMTWIMQYIGAALATFAYTGIYCLFLALMLHLCGQFTNLRDRVEGLVTVDCTSDQYHANMVEIVERHESLNRFARVIEKTFNPMFLAEMIACTIQFCMQGFLLVTLSFEEGMGLPILNLLFMIVYVMHIGMHLFICCYVADRLQDESSSISGAAYNCNWYNLKPKDAALIIMVMHRSKKTLQITAGNFCVFSLRLYAQIFKTSGGYLSMLLAVKDRIT